MNNAALQAQTARLKEEIKTLDDKRTALIAWFDTGEAKQLQGKFEELKKIVVGLEKNAADLDSRIFTADLRLATVKLETKAAQSDIDAAQKYLNYLHSIIFERETILVSIESRIAELKKDEKMLSMYAAKIKTATEQFESTMRSLAVVQSEVQSLILKKKEFEDDYAKKFKELVVERQKIDSYYNEVKEIADKVMEERESVRQQALALSGGSMVRFVKKNLNGGQ